MSGSDRTWHWDGEQWHWWNGHSWQIDDPNDPNLPPVPDNIDPAHDTPPVQSNNPPPTPQPTTAAAEHHEPPTSYGSTSEQPASMATMYSTPPGGKKKMSTAAILGIVGGIGFLALIIIGVGGFVLFRTLNSDSDVVAIQTEPLGSSIDPFTASVGTDTPVPSPVVQTNATPVVGGEVGLYGGTLNSATCNKDQLVSYLQATPDKAQAWAGVQGITVPEIPAFVSGLTSMLLRSDTLVVNHGFENGKATTFTSKLQAGTAVLVNNLGRPVVKCNCGNPLTAVTTTPTKVKYTGPRWTGFNETGFTIIQNNATVIQDFTVVNITTNTTFTRPVGTDGGQDVNVAGTPPDVASPAPTPTGTAPLPPSTTGGEQQAIAILSSGIDQCAVSLGGGIDYRPIAGNDDYYGTRVVPGSVEGVYVVTITPPEDGYEYSWSVNVNTGGITAANQTAAEFNAELCPNLESG